jgi:hypothetical protein
MSAAFRLLLHISTGWRAAARAGPGLGSQFDNRR